MLVADHQAAAARLLTQHVTVGRGGGLAKLPSNELAQGLDESDSWSGRSAGHMCVAAFVVCTDGPGRSGGGAIVGGRRSASGDLGWAAVMLIECLVCRPVTQK